MIRSIHGFAFTFLIASVALATTAVYSSTSSAKGNVYVLTGGELGDYAYTWVGIDIPGEGAREVPPPERMPDLKYDLFHSWGNLAVPWQIANGGAAYRYYPEARLLFNHDTNSGAPGVHWFRISVSTAGSLDRLIDSALGDMAAGRLERGAIAADLRARRMAEASYHVRPYADEPPIVIGEEASEPFVISALVGTLSRATLPAADVSSAYRTTYVASFEDGGGIGGLLGFYAPPRNGQPGVFWDDAYPDPLSQAYETTAEFDALVVKAQGPGQPSATSHSSDTATPSHQRVEAMIAASLMGVAILGSLSGFRLMRDRGHGVRKI
jgi:hypothetical protein